jgi:hypothetical protein
MSKELNLKQKTFCELFASDKEFFGNGVQSYIEAYDFDMTKKGAYNTAKANAHRLLTNADILEYINSLFEARGLNDVFVDKQLEKLITQDAEFSTKIKAIAEYNKLRGRITDKSEVKLKLPTVVLESVYGNNPKFRTDNTTPKAADVAEGSSNTPS